MRSRKRMWLDVDEVLCEFRTGVLKVAQVLFGRDFSHEPHLGWDVFDSFPRHEVDALVAEIHKEGFCASLPVREGSREAVQELRKHVDLLVVTSPTHSRHWVYERDEWLQNHFGFDRRRHIVHTDAKFLIKADICLDDKPANLVAWIEEHPDGLPLLWPTFPAHEIAAFHRVTGWDEVIALVKAFQLQPSLYELLEQREWQRQGDPYASGNYCLECGATVPGSDIPRHKPGCRVHEVLKRYRSHRPQESQ